MGGRAVWWETITCGSEGSPTDPYYIFISLIAVLTSVIGAVYYLNIIKEVFFYLPNRIISRLITSSLFVEDGLSKPSKLVSNICKVGVWSMNRFKLVDLHIKINYFIINSSIAIVISMTTLIVLLFILINREWLSVGTLLSGKSFQCLKLSNSGKALKLWVPQNKIGTKAICKWINNPFAVTIPKMMETEISNRGSKLIIVVCLIHIFVIIIKEQRVDGSWWKKYKNTWHPIMLKCFFHLRCTLMNLEINYPVQSLSKQIHTYRCNTICKLVYPCDSNKNNTFLAPIRTQKIHPWFITGFADGEGCFSINVIKNKKYKTGWMIILNFSINLHERDKILLEEIKNFFHHVGSISKHGPQSFQFKVKSIKNLVVIINHFEKFPLNTKKLSDYKFLEQAFKLIQRKEHLTVEGFQKILSIKASMNWGLSDKLKETFPDIIPAERPIVTNIEILDSYWLAGFISAEGCFLVSIFKATTNIGETVKLIFSVSQHSRDKILIKSFIYYFQCGNTNHEGNVINYKVTKFGDITQKIIPFFKKHPIQGVKSEDFKDFCLVAEMMKDKKHLTSEGLEKIKQIKARMNRGRY